MPVLSDISFPQLMAMLQPFLPRIMTEMVAR